MQHLQLVGWNLSDALGWHPVQGLAWEQHAPGCHQAAGQMEEDAGVAQPRGAQNRLALLSVCIVCQISVRRRHCTLQSLGNRRWVAQS